MTATAADKPAVKKVAKKAPAKKAVAKAPKAPKEKRTRGVPPQKKGTFRVRLRLPAVRALGLDDADKVKASGLTQVATDSRTATFDGSKTAMNNLLKDMNAISGDNRPKGTPAGAVWATKSAAKRVEKALAAGPYAGSDSDEASGEQATPAAPAGNVFVE